MAIEIYTEDETKIGELDQTGVQPSRGGCAKFGSQCYRVLDMFLTGTVTPGSPDSYKLIDGYVLVRACSETLGSATCKLCANLKGILP